MNKKGSNKHVGISYSLKHFIKSMRGSLLPLNKDYSDTIVENILSDDPLEYISAKEDKINLRNDARAVCDDLSGSIYEAKREFCPNGY